MLLFSLQCCYISNLTMRETENSSRKTIDKALRVLTAFSTAEPELTVGELAERLHLHKSVISRVVSSLRDWRMLEKDPHTRKIRIGENAFRIGSLYALHDDLSRISKPRMEQLVAKTEQSSHVTVLDRQQILVVATVDSPKALRVIMRLGERRSLHSTAAGKLFLAMTKGLLDAVLAKRLEAYTPETITSADRTAQSCRSRPTRSAGLELGRKQRRGGRGCGANPRPCGTNYRCPLDGLSTQRCR